MSHWTDCLMDDDFSKGFEYLIKKRMEYAHEKWLEEKARREKNGTGERIGITVYRSKFTPGIIAKETCFRKGEMVRYRTRNGQELDIIIDCNEKMKHNIVLLGYESIFTDDNSRNFAAEDGIIGWSGKCSKSEGGRSKDGKI